GKRGDMKSAERDVAPLAAIVVRDAIGPMSGRDIDLNHHQVRLVVEVEPFDVLILDVDLVVRIEVAGQRGEAEWGKQRVLDRPEERTGRFGERGKDHFHLHRALSSRTIETSRSCGPSSSTKKIRCQRPS